MPLHLKSLAAVDAEARPGHEHRRIVSSAQSRPRALPRCLDKGWRYFLDTRLAAAQVNGIVPRLREAEPCRVVGLSYLIADDGTEATYAALKLQFSDPASPVAGNHIYTRLPPPFVGGADFLVLRSRFDAAVARMWSIDDHCQVGALASTYDLHLFIQSFQGQMSACADTKALFACGIVRVRVEVSMPYPAPLWRKRLIAW